MRISFSACQQTPPVVTFPGGGMINMDQLLIPRRRKDKVVVVMGATGTGKSRLSIDLAKCFDAEVINSDKIQVYKGLDIVTNKVTEEECGGVPHHLLGVIDPDADFWPQDFVYRASAAADSITNRGRLPIIAGGSNSFVKALVHDDIEFRSRYECCFLWVDVEMRALNSFVSKRVDKMVESGLVAEAKEFFEPNGDYSGGIRRAIGVPELDEYFRNENFAGADELLESAIDEIKANTRTLAGRQLQNILRLAEQLESRVHRLDATKANLKRSEKGKEAWRREVAGPSTRIVGQFLYGVDRHRMVDFVSAMPPPATASIILGPTTTTVTTTAAVAAATH